MWRAKYVLIAFEAKDGKQRACALCRMLRPSPAPQRSSQRSHLSDDDDVIKAEVTFERIRASIYSSLVAWRPIDIRWVNERASFIRQLLLH